MREDPIFQGLHKKIALIFRGSKAQWGLCRHLLIFWCMHWYWTWHFYYWSLVNRYYAQQCSVFHKLTHVRCLLRSPYLWSAHESGEEPYKMLVVCPVYALDLWIICMYCILYTNLHINLKALFSSLLICQTNTFSHMQWLGWDYESDRHQLLEKKKVDKQGAPSVFDKCNWTCAMQYSHWLKIAAFQGRVRFLKQNFLIPFFFPEFDITEHDFAILSPWQHINLYSIIRD